MNETRGSVPVASSSKAVLTALRSLQDKIKRLEAEKSTVLDESTQLRHQIKNQELELEHLRQRESLAAQKALHEARNAYEKALTEKTETEVRLSKVEDRNRDEQRVAEELHAKMRSLEEEKHKVLKSMKDLEAQKSHLQSQITYTQQKEKGTSVVSSHGGACCCTKGRFSLRTCCRHVLVLTISATLLVDLSARVVSSDRARTNHPLGHQAARRGYGRTEQQATYVAG